MNCFTRPATPADTRQMADLAGPPVTADSLAAWMAEEGTSAAWHLVEDDRGFVLGFQQIGPDAFLPNDACAIATFLVPDPLPPGAGAALFDATAAAARTLGYLWIGADVAAENEAARVYYQNRGFRLYSAQNARQRMRFDLD